jgi:hypothetical protein
MSVVCEACGKSNRANAMFCSGCTRRLPGFVASGPSALTSQAAAPTRKAPEHDVVPTALDALAFRPPSRRPRGAGRSGGASDLPLLPAEAPMFWLRLGAVALVVLVGFVAWYFYVTRKIDVTPPTEMPVAAAPDSSATAAAPSPLPPPSTADTVAVPKAPPAPGTGKDLAAAPKPAGRPAPEAQARTTERERPAARARPSRTETARAPRAPRDAPEERGESRDPSPAVVARSLALARAQGDAAAANPGPDPGPVPRTGPGPRFADDNAVRAPSRAPPLPANDLGPPIAPGPGPQYDFSTPGARR